MQSPPPPHKLTHFPRGKEEERAGEGKQTGQSKLKVEEQEEKKDKKETANSRTEPNRKRWIQFKPRTEEQKER